MQKMDKKLKDSLNSYGINLKKAFGQNFLTDNDLLLDIVKKSGVGKNDTVLEIGCGAGALTEVLAQNVKTVYGYEIDLRLKPILKSLEDKYLNVHITFNDIMKEKTDEIEKRIGGEYVMVANLPYYITTPIIMNFLENAKNLRAMVIMVQKEVAERLASKPSGQDYGAITVAINLRGKAEIIKYVGKEMFTPVPKVDSAVIKIDIDKNKNAGVDMNKVRNIVRVAFSSRRKMLVNNLMNGYNMPREKALAVLEKAGLSATVRGEQLSEDDYIRLSEVIYE